MCKLYILICFFDRYNFKLISIAFHTSIKQICLDCFYLKELNNLNELTLSILGFLKQIDWYILSGIKKSLVSCYNYSFFSHWYFYHFFYLSLMHEFSVKAHISHILGQFKKHIIYHKLYWIRIFKWIFLILWITKSVFYHNRDFLFKLPDCLKLCSITL